MGQQYNTAVQQLTKANKGELFLVHNVPRPDISMPEIYGEAQTNRHRIIAARFAEFVEMHHPEVMALQIMGYYACQLATKGPDQDNYSLTIEERKPPVLAVILDYKPPDEIIVGDQVYEELDRLGIPKYRPLIERIQWGGQIEGKMWGKEGTNLMMLVRDLSK